MAKRPTATPDHLSGKRRWIRQSRVIEVICIGAGGTVRARTVDISRGGVLVEAIDADVPPLGDGDLVPLAYLAAVAFADGMKVVLGPELTVRADVVRVTTSPCERSFLRLGCRFRRPLTAKQSAQLGIDETDVPDPSLTDAFALDRVQEASSAAESSGSTAEARDDAVANRPASA
jgi:hypothetical protein